jgi:hypothetical protein
MQRNYNSHPIYKKININNFLYIFNEIAHHKRL